MDKYSGETPYLSEDGFEIYYEFREGDGFKGLDFIVKINDEDVAEAEFVKSSLGLHCNVVEVDEDYRRKGIANTLYVLAEILIGCKVKNVWKNTESQTDMGKKLWVQKDRPWG